MTGGLGISPVNVLSGGFARSCRSAFLPFLVFTWKPRPEIFDDPPASTWSCSFLVQSKLGGSFTRLYPALRRQRQVHLLVPGLPGLPSPFQDSQGLTQKLFRKSKPNHPNNQINKQKTAKQNKHHSGQIERFMPVMPAFGRQRQERSLTEFEATLVYVSEFQVSQGLHSEALKKEKQENFTYGMVASTRTHTCSSRAINRQAGGSGLCCAVKCYAIRKEKGRLRVVGPIGAAL